MDYKKDFPIFEANDGLVYLDSASTAQKPKMVIDGIKDFLSTDYANIHRWAYSLSERSEELYFQSKQEIAKLINAASPSEISYTYNSTYAVNIVANMARRSWFLRKWDKILVSISEHHANIVPWLILKEDMWIEVDFVGIWDDYDLDFSDLEKKLTSDVKLVSLTHVSNVTWKIFDVARAMKIIKTFNQNILTMIDASQSIPHIKIDVQEISCDFLAFTWHKMMADTWIWVLYVKKGILDWAKQPLWWWWAISSVSKTWYSPSSEHFLEPGTPNITWAVSLLRAIEYMESIWWYEAIKKKEEELISYMLERFQEVWDKVSLIWSKDITNRLSVFSFKVDWAHSSDIAYAMAESDICIRSWMHCAEPLLNDCWVADTFRVSLYIYNNKEDIDAFFDTLKNVLNELL